jgi:putative hydroxymethylpyrimidine transport system substrate-binding protein
MREVAALLAAVVALIGSLACGDDGAEPGAPRSATLVLDFTPSAVHSGIYAALARGLYRQAGVELTVREPGESSDAPKLLEAGRTEFAILDIHDLGLAREQGLEAVGVLPIVQRPLASVIARADGPVQRPRDLEGRTVGVTGLPSDDAVLDSVVEGDRGDPDAVERVTIGFNAVASLAAGRVDGVTAFWNAEGVALRRAGVPVRVFKVDRYGAPPYPELVLCTTSELLAEDNELVEGVRTATERGYEFVARSPEAGLEALLDANPELERDEQAAQLAAVSKAIAPAPFDRSVLHRWAGWDLRHGILSEPLDVGAAFPPSN